MSKYTFTLTEVNNWVGGDGVAKVKAMLVNGKCLNIPDNFNEVYTDVDDHRRVPG